MKMTLLSVILFVLSAISASADEPQKFSPEKFQADMERFITQQAQLTADEAARFFPLLREMQQKQRAIYGKMKKECSQKPADEMSCKKLVQKCDTYELELKKIQKVYHEKFFDVLTASKVYDVLKAEERFHRRAFKNWGQQGQKHNQKEHQK